MKYKAQSKETSNENIIIEKIASAVKKSIEVQGGLNIPVSDGKQQGGVPLWFILLQVCEIHNAGNRHADVVIPIRNGRCGKMYTQQEKHSVFDYRHLFEGLK